MNLQKMMKQAQQMQKQMTELQEKMELQETEGTAGGGMVTVLINGKGIMKKINIDPKIIDPTEKEMLEDLIIAAFNDAKNKAEGSTSDEMAKITSGLNLPPGMKLPF